MRRVLVTLAFAVAVSTDVAAAQAPVSGWQADARVAIRHPAAVAVDGTGRGVIVFGRGRGVWAATVSPDGAVGPSVPIRGPQAKGGVLDLQVAISARGDIVASWDAYNGQNPAGVEGYGFVIRPVVARWRWGRRPGRARLLVRGRVNVRFPLLAMRPDGTAALAFPQSDPGGADIDLLRVAVIPPVGRPWLETVDGVGAQETFMPLGLDTDRAGRFHVAWSASNDSGDVEQLRLATSDARGRFARPADFAADDHTLGTGTVLTTPAGSLDVWQDGNAIRLAHLRSGAARFGFPMTIAHPSRRVDNLTAAGDGSGRTVVAWSVGDRVYAVVREPGGRLRPSRRLGAGLQAPGLLTAVGADGRAVVAFEALHRPDLTVGLAMAPRASPFGRATALGRNCDPVALTVAGGDRGLLAIACDGERGYIVRI